MKRAMLVASATVLTLCPHSISGQEPTADEILRTVHTAGTIDPVLDYVTMNGCPQQDDRGRQWFDLLSNATFSPPILVELARLWNHAFIHCGYGPVQNWYVRALEELVSSDDRLAVEAFVRLLPGDISPRMRDLIWREVESGIGPSVYENVLAGAAVRGGTLGERLARTLSAFQDRRTSLEWVRTETTEFIMEAPGLFLRGLAQASPSIPDDRLAASLAVVRGITSRSADISDGLRAVRESVRDRQGIPAQLRQLGAPN